MSLRRLALAAVLTLLALPALASPLVMRATITGIVGPRIGDDVTGVFGPPNTDLLGAAFTLTFTYDLSVGQRTIAPTSDELTGGLDLGLPDPLIDTSLTINGTTVHIPTGGRSLFSAAAGSFNAAVASPVGTLQSNHVFMFISSPLLPASLDSDIAPIAITGGEDFQIRTDSPTGGPPTVFAVGQLVGQTFQRERVPVVVSEPPLLVALGLAALLLGSRRTGLGTPREPRHHLN